MMLYFYYLLVEMKNPRFKKKILNEYHKFSFKYLNMDTIWILNVWIHILISK